MRFIAAFNEQCLRTTLLAASLVCLTGCPQDEHEYKPEANIPVEMNRHTKKPKLLYLSGTLKCVAYNKDIGGSVFQDSCAAETNHAVEISEVSEKIYNIKIPSTEFCLEVSDASTENGAQTRFAPCNGQENQKIIFHTSKIDFLFRKIVFAHSGKCLGASGLQRSNGIEMTQDVCRDVIWQDFLVTEERLTKRSLPRTIWSFWDKGAHAMPAFYRANVKRWEELLNHGADEDKKWTIKVLNLIPDDENYYGNFIDTDSIPDVNFIAAKIGNEPFEKKLKPAVVFSDFLRLELLYRFGGAWLDPSIILHSNLDNVVNVLEVLNNFSMGAFTSRAQGSYPLRYADSFENFFIVAFPEIDLMNHWKTDFKKYWDLKQPGMRIQDNPLYNGNLGVKMNVSSFGNLADYLNEHIAFKYTLLTHPGSLNEVLILGDASPAEKGPFTLLSTIYWNDSRLFQLGNDDRNDMVHELHDVLLSKFPSENSRRIREETEVDYFFRSDNIFGQLNGR